MRISYTLNHEEPEPGPKFLTCTDSVYVLYIQNLRVLVLAYQRIAPHPFTRSFDHCSRCPFAHSETPANTGIGGECSSRRFLPADTSIADEGHVSSLTESIEHSSHCLLVHLETPTSKGIRGARSIRRFLHEDTGIADDGHVAWLTESNTYLEEIAEIWKSLPVEPHWIFVWEAVAGCRL